MISPTVTRGAVYFLFLLIQCNGYRRESPIRVDENLYLKEEEIPLNKILIASNIGNNYYYSKNVQQHKDKNLMISTSSIGRFPFMLSLQILDTSGNLYHICSAVLVATNMALTSASCVYYYFHNASYTHYIDAGSSELPNVNHIKKVKDVVLHNHYLSHRHKRGFRNNVALLILEEHLYLGFAIKIANLTTNDEPRLTGSKLDGTCFSVGWRCIQNSSSSCYVGLNVETIDRMSNYLCRLFLKIFKPPAVFWSHVCAGIYQKRCYDETGGILVCGKDKKVWGIASYRPDCTGCRPVVFSRLSSYHHWLKEQIWIHSENVQN